MSVAAAPIAARSHRQENEDDREVVGSADPVEVVHIDEFADARDSVRRASELITVARHAGNGVCVELRG